LLGKEEDEEDEEEEEGRRGGGEGSLVLALMSATLCCQHVDQVLCTQYQHSNGGPGPSLLANKICAARQHLRDS
jgi:hypothetical protein